MRVATVQGHPLWLDKKATTSKVVELLEECKRKGADLAVLSETFLAGYPFWVCRTNGAAFNDPRQKHAYALYVEAAVEVAGPELQLIREAAGDLDLFVFLGLTERGTGGASGSVYCSLAAVDPAGGVVGVHRKLVPTHDERLVWARGDGHGLRTYTYKGLRLGGLICWENWMPQARFALYSQGVDVYVSVWPGWSGLTQDITRFIALEGRCYSVASSGLLSLDDITHDFPMLDEIRQGYPNELFDGGSGIVAPDGRWLAGPAIGQESILLADAEPRIINEERLMFDVAGHYSRPDVFESRVNMNRQKATKFDLDR
jgi:nitrilase